MCFLAVAMRMQSIIKEWDESVGGGCSPLIRSL